jgi:hypothetical protein
MEEDEQLSVLMAGLRGSNINSSDFADEDVVMKVPLPCQMHHLPRRRTFGLPVHLNIRAVQKSGHGARWRQDLLRHGPSDRLL